MRAIFLCMLVSASSLSLSPLPSHFSSVLENIVDGPICCLYLFFFSTLPRVELENSSSLYLYICWSVIAFYLFYCSVAICLFHSVDPSKERNRCLPCFSNWIAFHFKSSCIYLHNSLTYNYWIPNYIPGSC